MFQLEPSPDGRGARQEAPGAGPLPAAPEVEAVLAEALAWLRRRVGYDAARGLAYDPAVLIPVSFAANDPQLDWEHTVAACRNEQAETDVHKFRDLARSRMHVGVLTAESAQAQQSPRWQNLLLPDGWRHELRAAAVDDHGHCWGSIAALRGAGRPFTEKDAAAIGRELAPIAARLSRAMVSGAAPPPPGHAASLWLSDTGELLFTTPTGREWLDRLRTPEAPGRADAVLAGLAVRVAAGTAGSGTAGPGTASPGPVTPAGPPRPVLVRARGAGGQWIALHGETITGPGGEAQGISVVIGPARPGTVLPVLAAAYGLTAREREVIRAVFAGLSTKDISARLHISTYTVQDHLKAIFSKVGVTSRGELAHQLALQFT
jgi:DNA-binding CsgD family transcriptional regulator